jgi:hypothetical protein
MLSSVSAATDSGSVSFQDWPVIMWMAASCLGGFKALNTGVRLTVIVPDIEGLETPF